MDTETVWRSLRGSQRALHLRKDSEKCWEASSTSVGMSVVLSPVVRPRRAGRPAAGSAPAPKSRRVHTDASSCHHSLRAVATVTLSALPEEKDSRGTRGTVSLDREGGRDSNGRPIRPSERVCSRAGSEEPVHDRPARDGFRRTPVRPGDRPEVRWAKSHAADVSFQGRGRGQTHFLTHGAHQHRSTASGETPEGVPLISVHRLRAP